MSFVKINLIAPNSLPISGAKLDGGGLAEVSFFYNRETLFSDFVIEHTGKQVVENEGEVILVDEKGNEWKISEVEEYSLFHS